MPADTTTTTTTTTTATPPFDELVAQWVMTATSISRKEKLKVLREELRAVRFAGKAAEETQSGSLAALEEARAHVMSEPDAARLRRAAEELTVTTDLDTLYDLVDPGCVLALAFESRCDSACCVGVDEVVGELCDQQESILACRGDLVGRRSAGVRGTSRRRNSSGVVVHGVSEVSSWVRPCTSDEPPSPQVGTQVTFYADSAKTEEVFSLHSLYTFTVDGRRVEHIARTLVPRDAFNAAGVLREVHFGSFGREAAAQHA